ncbi:hypothetical protein PG993_015055 [Apiospora rasikravindrae]|uniref:Carboxylic ester hydrolase n=1 Tax=Apiospora rasikravindrae TaxID=990691 RepID=A0ABR1RQM7_9PEZI
MDQLASFLGYYGSATMGPGSGLSSCAASSIPYPTSLPTAKFLSVEAHMVTNYTVTVPPGFENSSTAPYSPVPVLNFCNVTLTYTHPGLGDKIKTQVWLPWAIWMLTAAAIVIPATRKSPTAAPSPLLERPPPRRRRRRSVHRLHPANSGPRPRRGYAVVTTDGGHLSNDPGDATWVLASTGNVDWVAVQNFAAIAVHDAAVIGRAVTEAFYGERVKYAYFTGCSTGGRQAAVLAQRWPGDYDGYLAGAAAMRSQDITAALGPQAKMVELGYAPPACEMRELRRLAIEKCDGLDGAMDGLVSEPERCFGAFDPRAHVGDEFVCEETGEAVEIAQLAWEGLRVGDGVVWGGVGHQADLAESWVSWAATSCDYNTGTTPPACKPKPWPFATAWVQYFLLQDPATPADPTAFFKSGLRDIERLVYQGRQWYTSIISAFDTDLSALRDGGGKLLMWHGMADEAIPLNNSRAYYDAVAARDPGHIDDYLRYFEAPGVSHCGTGGDGNGLFPARLLDALRAWVEEGKAPESVPAVSKAADPETGITTTRNLCRYPRKTKYDGVGDVASAASFRCV